MMHSFANNFNKVLIVLNEAF